MEEQEVPWFQVVQPVIGKLPYHVYNNKKKNSEINQDIRNENILPSIPFINLDIIFYSKIPYISVS